MARGDSPNSRANLEKGKPFDKETARIAKQKSDEAKKQRKTLREELLALLEDADTQEKVSLALIQQAKKGNTKAFEVIRDTIGEKPVDKVEQTSTNIVIDFGNIEGDE